MKKQTNRLTQDNTPSSLTKNASLDAEELIMPAMMQKEEFRQDYIYMMGEHEERENTDMNTFEEFGGEVSAHLRN